MIRALDVESGFHGPFGFDRHVRGAVSELHRRGVAIHLFDRMAPPAADGPSRVIDPLFDHLTRPVGARVALSFRMPHEVKEFPGRSVVNSTMFETTRVHPSWARMAAERDLTMLPNEFCRQVWLDSGAPADRLRICPIGVDRAMFASDLEPLPLWLPDGRRVRDIGRRFLNISALTPRKNITGLIRAWLRATTPHDDAVLLLKLSFFAPSDGLWLESEIEQARTDAGKQLAAAAPMLLILRTFPDREMPRLYAAATHYLSVSHGEGWDMPMSEAAAAGLRLIAPAHSGYLAYLDSSVARLLPSREVPVHWPVRGQLAQLFGGSNWWDPDEDATIAAIRDAIAGRDAPAASARDRMRERFTWERVGDRLIEILDEAEALNPRRPARRRPR